MAERLFIEIKEEDFVANNGDSPWAECESKYQSWCILGDGCSMEKLANGQFGRYTEIGEGPDEWSIEGVVGTVNNIRGNLKGCLRQEVVNERLNRALLELGVRGVVEAE